MTIGRIGGPMLKENLIRQGVDLSFETNLLYLDVNNMRVGVNTDTPNVAMDINGVTRFSSNLQINGSNIATYANNENIILTPHGTGKVVLSYLTANQIPYATTNGAVIDSSNLTFDGTTLSVTGLTLAGTANIAVGNLKLSGNSIASTDINGDIILDPEGTGSIIVDSTDVTANRVFYSGTSKEILTNANLTFDGINLVLSGNANVTTLNVSTISSLTTNGNINLDPNGTGNVLLDTATSSRIIYTGANKELLTNSNLLFNGTTVTIGNISLSGNTINTTSGNLNVSATGRVVFDSTSSIRVPVGDTSERPSPVIGDIRFNTELETLEFYTGYDWSAVQAQIIYLLSDTYNGDGSTAVFTLSQTTSSDGAFITLNGVVQTPGVAYGISGTTLTFTEAPASGDRVDVRYLTLSNEVAVDKIQEGNTSVLVDDDAELANVTINGVLQVQINSTTTKINNNFATTTPVTKTGDFSLQNNENFVINNKSGSTCIVTLPSAASHPGRQVTFKTIQAQALDSASSNVCPLNSATPGTSILTASAGKWATVVSDGTNWIIMAAN